VIYLTMKQSGLLIGLPLVKSRDVVYDVVV